MYRTIEDYDSMTKREIIKAKQEKGQMYVSVTMTEVLLNAHSAPRRVQKFRADYTELKSLFEQVKSEVCLLCVALVFRIAVAGLCAASCYATQ